jgi:peroxiredoxin Q/BCP
MHTLETAVLTQAFESTSGPLTLNDFAGKHIVLYFYPKDNTPGCSIESMDFRDNLETFKQHNAVILGVSRDSLKSHENFINKKELNFTLISDADSQLCEAFDVIKEKSMFGKKYMGIERSTFIIGPTGEITHEWRKVKVKGHATAVLKALSEV